MAYKKKYLKIYFWRIVAYVLSFCSLFIVAPLTTSMPEVFGVYSLCISFNVFLTYADLGFITAGQKYASEAFARGERNQEKKYVYTSINIYGIMSFILFAIGLFVSFSPALVIKGISPGTELYEIAQKLLLILAFTFPLSIFSKYSIFIYTIRLEDYKTQRIQILASVIKIASVPLVFFHNKYDIVGYYLFCSLVDVFSNIYLVIKSRSIGYGIQGVWECLKFDKSTFNEMKPLALGGFTACISWILYYELDILGISVLIGANAVAIYSVAKSLQTVVRSFMGIIYSPFVVRINYFIGQNDLNGLKNFFYTLSEEFSFTIIPIIIFALFAEPFVISWVGPNYTESVVIMQLLVICFIFNYVTSLSGSIIYGLNKVREIYKLAIFQPLFFWIGVLSTFYFFGVRSFAIFQLTGCTISALYYCYLVVKFLNFTYSDVFGKLLLKNILLAVVVSVFLWVLFSPSLANVTKNHFDLFKVVITMGVCCILAGMASLLYNKPLRNEIHGLYYYIANKK